jgi:hypothetical protein
MPHRRDYYLFKRLKNPIVSNSLDSVTLYLSFYSLGQSSYLLHQEIDLIVTLKLQGMSAYYHSLDNSFVIVGTISLAFALEPWFKSTKEFAFISMKFGCCKSWGFANLSIGH